MKLVIGLVGRIGAGKGFVGDYICSEYGAKKYVFSDILKDILKRLHLQVTRENLIALGIALRQNLGEQVVVDAMRRDIEKDSMDMIVVDGIRYENEVAMLRTFENSLLLDITALPEIRYERCKARGEKGEDAITFDEFLKVESRETEKHIGKIEKMSDYVLENNRSAVELTQKIDEIIRKKHK